MNVFWYMNKIIVAIIGVFIISYIYKESAYAAHQINQDLVILYNYAMLATAFVTGLLVELIPFKRKFNFTKKNIAATVFVIIVLGFFIYVATPIGLVHHGLNPFGFFIIQMNQWADPFLSVLLGILTGKALTETF